MRPPAMIAVRRGRVSLTDRRTRHTWTVELMPYLLSTVPVTQAQFSEVTGQRPSAAHGDDFPVEGVSWLMAVGFCNQLSERAGLTPVYSMSGDQGVTWEGSADGYRLPTEAEWEHACRAGTPGARYGPLGDIAWYRGNSGGAVHEVGGKEPNQWGFHDMLGNVWEWCWDLYDSEIYGSYRMLRGGGWNDDHWSCRASVRRRSHPTFQIDDVGFRVARSVSA